MSADLFNDEMSTESVLSRLKALNFTLETINALQFLRKCSVHVEKAGHGASGRILLAGLTDAGTKHLPSTLHYWPKRASA